MRCSRWLRDDQGGFTLIELMIVVLILAVLMVIAIPTFLDARRRAMDRAAQTTARNALSSAKSIFADAESYAGATLTALREAEPGLTLVDGAVSSPSSDVASVTAGTTLVSGDTFVAAVYSKSGRCFWIRDVALPASAYPGLGTTYSSRPSSGADCTAADTTGLAFAPRF